MKEQTDAVGILGLGYMGLTTGLAFAAHGRMVSGFDINEQTRSFIAKGVTPYKERGLGSLLRTQIRAGKFRLVDSVEELVQSVSGIFVSLPTPSQPNGSIDLGPIKTGLNQLGKAIRQADGFRVVVVKSTVVPGTTEGVIEPLLRRLSHRQQADLGVAANPEFLAEGTMVRDALSPDRLVLGISDNLSRRWLDRAYRGFRGKRFYLTPTEAELTKYASNVFLALKVSYVNEISRLTERLGVDIDRVMRAVGADHRIGSSFLSAGPGFGGSCFDKDTRALIASGRSLGINLRAAEVALAINNDQTNHVIDLIGSGMGGVRNKRVALLGLAFKAGTDDVRGSRAISIVRALIHRVEELRLHDPLASENFYKLLVSLRADMTKVRFCKSVRQAIEGADAAVVQTDWVGYKDWRPDWTRRMRSPLIIDLRRCVRVRPTSKLAIRVLRLGVGEKDLSDDPCATGKVGGVG